MFTYRIGPVDSCFVFVNTDGRIVNDGLERERNRNRKRSMNEIINNMDKGFTQPEFTAVRIQRHFAWQFGDTVRSTAEAEPAEVANLRDQYLFCLLPRNGANMFVRSLRLEVVRSSMTEHLWLEEAS